MARIVRDRIGRPGKSPLPAAPTPPRGSGMDQQRQQDTADSLGVARCPWCHAPLVVRMSCAGPYWHCLCVENPFQTRPCGRKMKKR